MNGKHVKGIAVISIADGKKLGSIDHVLFDRASRRVVGFAIHEGGGLLSAEPDRGSIVDTADVHSLGPDAMTLADGSAMRGETTAASYGDLVDLDELTKLKAVTEGGTYVGQVTSVEFDERGFGLRSIEVSPGFFQGNKTIPVEQVVSIGDDVVVVTDEVCVPESEATAGGAATTTGVEPRFVVTGAERPSGR